MSTVYVLKNKQGQYLAPTYRTKFDSVRMGDCVPEQAYAQRYYERNTVAMVAVELNRNGVNEWRMVLLKPKSSVAILSDTTGLDPTSKGWDGDCG